MEYQIKVIRLIIKSLIICVFASPVFSDSVEDIVQNQSKISASLIAMGYIDIQFDGCKIQFSREIGGECSAISDKAQYNTHLVSYRRNVDVSILAWNDSLELNYILVEHPDYTGVYGFSVPLSPIADALSDAALDFLLSLNFDGERYEFTTFSPSTPNFTESVLDKFPDIESVPHWKLNSCFGESIIIEGEYQMSWPNKIPLENLMGGLQSYSQSCEGWKG